MIEFKVHSKTHLGDTSEEVFPTYRLARAYFEKLADDKDIKVVSIYDGRNAELLSWTND